MGHFSLWRETAETVNISSGGDNATAKKNRGRMGAAVLGSYMQKNPTIMRLKKTWHLYPFPHSFIAKKRDGREKERRKGLSDKPFG